MPVHHVTRAAALLQPTPHAQAVVLVATVQAHLLARGVQAVVACTTHQGVITRQRLRGQVVVARAAVQHVGALVVRQRVVAVATVQAVVAKVAFDLVVAVTTAQRVAARLAVYRVCTT